MKRYAINKDFIPKEFIRARNSKNRQKDKKFVLILLFLALLLLPVTIMHIIDNEDKTSYDINISSVENKDVDIDLWINILEKYDLEGEFDPYEACIYLEGEEKLDEIASEDKININSMEDLGENKYRVRISKK